MLGDLKGLRHIEDLPADGGSVTLSGRQRRAAARTGAGIMIDDMVGRRGPLQSGSLVAGRRLSDVPLRVRWGPLFFFRPSLAGDRELVVLSSAALRSSSAIRSRKWAFSRSSASFSLTSAALRRSSPWPGWL